MLTEALTEAGRMADNSMSMATEFTAFLKNEMIDDVVLEAKYFMKPIEASMSAALCLHNRSDGS